jgi:hypothetical protein
MICTALILAFALQSSPDVYPIKKEGGWLIIEQVWAGPPIEADAK